jgi:hypothetical protein
MKFAIQTRYDVSAQRIADLLITAREGGSNYWMDGYEPELSSQGSSKPVEQFTFYGLPEDKTLYKFVDYPLNGHHIIICDNDCPNEEVSDQCKGHRLNSHTIQNGINRYAQRYPNKFFSVLVDENGDYDAGDADVFLQLCIYGDVIFG